MAPSSSVANRIFVAAACEVSEASLADARLGQRFGRLDLHSQLALLAVENLGVDFEALPRDRVAILLAARTGSLSTDIRFWKSREDTGGPSPTLFAYTLPSAAIGEIAIRYRLTGPDLCLVGDDSELLPEAADMIRSGRADACVCVATDVATEDAAALLRTAPSATARAALLIRGTNGLCEWPENRRDSPSLRELVLLAVRGCGQSGNAGFQ